METFSALLAFCAGNSPVPVNFPHKGQWRGALMFSLICARTNRWINNREAGDLRRHQAHYDVIVMKTNAIEEVTLMTELRTVRSLVSLVTVYPIKYAHVYVLFCCVVSWAPRDACHLFIYIVQDYLLFQNALEFLLSFIFFKSSPGCSASNVLVGVFLANNYEEIRLRGRPEIAHLP